MFLVMAGRQDYETTEFAWLLSYAYAAMLSLMFALNVGVRIAAVFGVIANALLWSKLGPSPALVICLVYSALLLGLAHFRAAR